MTVTRLADALPRAPFVEQHARTISSPVERAWGALEGMHYLDLTMTRPLLAARSLGRIAASRDDPSLGLFGSRAPTPLLYAEAPTYVAGGRIARPWKPRPDLGPQVSSLTDLADFDEPGWVRMGMEFTLQPLSPSTTRITTTTRVDPTDATARDSFRRYWLLIRPFSGLIRRDMLRVLARRA